MAHGVARGDAFCPSTADVRASGSYQTRTPDRAFDCDDTTVWNAGGPGGTLTATFTQVETISGVQITAQASPETDETYIVRASLDGKTWSTLARKTFRIPTGGPV